MPIRQKLMFSQRKIEFLEDFGNRVDQLTKTKDDHEKLAEVMKKEAKVDERSNRNRYYKKEYCLKKIGLIHIKNTGCGTKCFHSAVTYHILPLIYIHIYFKINFLQC